MTNENPETTPAGSPEEAPEDGVQSPGSGWQDKRLLLLFGATAVALAVVGVVLISKGSGGGSAALSPKVLHRRLEIQYLLGQGSTSPQGRLLAASLPRNSQIACWQEGTERVCAAAVPKGYSSGAVVDDTSKWTFYRATFPLGAAEPEVEEVEPEESLNPGRAASEP